MIEGIIDIARKAGDVTMKYYRKEIDINLKEDRSPVTEADKEANTYIVKRLKEMDRTIPVISEEARLPDYEERQQWERFWLVDPLDGTKEFIKGLDEFTVNIALIEKGVPVMGVVVAPALDITYYSEKGKGSWKMRNSHPAERIYSEKADEGQPLRVVVSRSHASGALEQYLEKFNVEERIPSGSSLKFCLVAEGKADIYPRTGPTMEWDVAAGDCVYRYSAQTGTHSSSLTYNKPDLRNEGFVIGF